MSSTPFTTYISQRIWDTKYRFGGDGGVADTTIEDTWRRIAVTLAAEENDPQWQNRFYEALSRFRFLPGGRILAGAGTGRRVTLFNCFVMEK